MKHVVEIEGVKKVQKVKYLGMWISLNRTQIRKDAQNMIEKVLYVMRGRIQSQRANVKIAIFTAYLRSLIIYYFTSMVTAGFAFREDVVKYEAKIKRKFLGLPADLTSQLIQNVSQWYDRNTDSIIAELANKVEAKINP